MTKVLYVTSSPRAEESYSNKVAALVLDEIRRLDPVTEVTVRDLAREPLQHIDEEFLSATRSPEGALTEHQTILLARSDALVDELLSSDIVVIAAPMINFGIPSTLKTWIDYVSRAGKTFAYSESGVQGLIAGKKAFIVAARGGIYSGENKALDFQLPYLESVLGFLGLTDITSFEVEGTALGPDSASKAVNEAALKIHESFARAA